MNLNKNWWGGVAGAGRPQIHSWDLFFGKAFLLLPHQARDDLRAGMRKKETRPTNLSISLQSLRGTFASERVATPNNPPAS